MGTLLIDKRRGRELKRLRREQIAAEIHARQPAPLPTFYSIRKPDKPKRIEHWIAKMHKRWQRYLKRFDRQLPADAPIRTDVRYYEARACKIDIRTLDGMIWFFGLHPINRHDL